MRDAVWWPKNWTNIWSSLFFFLFAYNFVQISKANKSKPSLKIGSVNKAFFVLIYHDIDNGLENIFLGIKLFFSRWKTETFSICLKKNLLTSQNFDSNRQPIQKICMNDLNELSLNMPRDIQKMVIAVLIFSEGFAENV